MIHNFLKVTPAENGSTGLELPEYKTRPLNLSVLLPPGCLIHLKASDHVLGGVWGSPAEPTPRLLWP